MEKAVTDGNLEKIVVVPNLIPFGKPGASSLEIRWQLLKAATQNDPHVIVPDLSLLQEIQQRGGTNMDVLKAIQSQSPQDEWVSVMGADSLEKLLNIPPEKRIPIKVIMARRGNDSERIVAAARAEGIEVKVIPGGMEFSSSQYRANPKVYSSFVPASVQAAVEKNGYYGLTPAAEQTKTPPCDKLYSQIYAVTVPR